MTTEHELLSGIDRVLETLPASDLGQLAQSQRDLVCALVAGAAPRESLLNLRRFVEANPELRWPAANEASTVAKVLSSGPELARLLVSRPHRLELLLDGDLCSARSKETLAEELTSRLAPDLDDEALAAELCAFRNDHFIRLAAREFDNAPLEQVGRELADLADVCLAASLDHVLAGLSAQHGPPLTANGQPCPLTAVAFGKYGAQELNFCSDIDIAFFYDTDDGQAGELSLHEFFATVCQRIVRLFSSAPGLIFRIDLRLRPEGDSGPICNSLEGAERYYETWGGPYDRLAWLKARPAAGDLRLGDEMLQLMHAFVFPRSLRPDIIDEIHHLSSRIRSELSGARSLVRGWNVKLGEGGIRDVEFFVQALQLVHGGRQPSLQQRSTLAALDRLLFCGLIAEQEQRLLVEAYDLYRKIEHRLQLHSGHQTHLLPDAGELREQVIKHLGFEGEEDFSQLLADLRLRVGKVYATLGVSADNQQDLVGQIVDMPDADAREQLATAGFAEPTQALSLLLQLQQKLAGPFGQLPSAVARRIRPSLFAEICHCPDPDAALRHFTSLSLRYGPFDGLWTMLDEDHDLLRLLCSLFGTSDYLARMFVAHPELLDQLLLAGDASPCPSPESLRDALTKRRDGQDIETQLGTLRRFRNEEVLRIGLRDIAGDLSIETVWKQLTAVAEAVVATLYPLLLAEMVQRYGQPIEKQTGDTATMSVIGLGKLGAQELGYAADLDLIFVYSADGQTNGERSVSNGEFFARLAQRIVNSLAANLEDGRLYEVDTRLRPSGAQGMLVVSREALAQYHHDQAATWEKQVLTRARAVAGDADLGQALERWIGGYLYAAPHDNQRLGEEIDSMRRRLQRELAGEKADFYNLKVGRGGLLDIEFIAQYLQLRFGSTTVGLRATATMAVLQAARQNGLLSAEAARVLSEGYLFLRRLESRLRIVRDRSADRLPGSPEALTLIARRLGYRKQGGQSAGEQILADYLEHTGAIRTVYEEIIVRDRPA